jgi:AcrR family transcriptional regulator
VTLVGPGAGLAAPARADRQRERILRAARACFTRDGFHAATMAQIASAAEMSPGLIYRYFPSKSAIVQAIVDRQMEETRRSLGQIGSADDLVSAILASFERWCEPGTGGEDTNAALLLEILAVGARDPAVAEALRQADSVLRASLGEALERSLVGTTTAEQGPTLPCRVTMLQCLVEGLLVRAVRQPDLDRRLLRRSLERALAGIGPGCPAAPPAEQNDHSAASPPRRDSTQ